MPDESLALSTIPPPPAERDFDAICAAMMATARGRWFLEEYARRNRNADTVQVVGAIERMQAAVESERAQHASRAVRLELHEMARAITQARTAAPPGTDEPAPDIAGVAERLRDIAHTMQARGVELATSTQIAELAEAILAAAALRNPDDRRTRQLGEVLHYLEQRIDRMLDAEPAAAAETALPQLASPADSAGDSAAELPTELQAESPTEPPVAPSVTQSITVAEPPPNVAQAPQVEAAMPPAAATDRDSVAIQVERDLDDLFDAPAPAAAPPPVTAATSSDAPAGAEAVAERTVIEQIAFELARGRATGEPAAETRIPSMWEPPSPPEEPPANAEPGPVPDAPPRPAAAAAPSPVSMMPASTPPPTAMTVPASRSAPSPAADATVFASSAIAAQAIAGAMANDPLAALRAMTDEERIALFT